MAHTFITITGADIIPGDVLKRLPGVPVVSAEPVDPRHPHSQTLHMADGSLYFIDPQQTYVVARDAAPAPLLAVLVTGPCDTADDLDALQAAAYGVALTTGRTAVAATHTAFDVSQFAALYVAGPLVWDDADSGLTSTLLQGEAFMIGAPVEPVPAEPADGPTLCNHCFEPDDTHPVRVGEAWVPLCMGCLRAARGNVAGDTAPILFVGDDATELGDLRAAAFDACDQLGVTVVVAEHGAHDVRRFSAVLTWSPARRPVASPLVAEALLCGLTVEPWDANDGRPAPVMECSTCDTGREVDPVWVAERGAWVPSCKPCARRAGIADPMNFLVGLAA
ncbi:hypothetical protein [Streptomyces sp. PLM4]|uniref:hypothetical protein n=1 Tax=Streptomyces sp. PLM4 TaxID=2929798 RepID=UPI0020483768|nr:hypothetical protein [Streptomyces sp. PLM4]BDH67018.1 hypothetical protein MTP06_04670 [Streptomyces sp. PLM4]